MIPTSPSQWEGKLDSITGTWLWAHFLNIGPYIPRYIFWFCSGVSQMEWWSLNPGWNEGEIQPPQSIFIEHLQYVSVLVWSLPEASKGKNLNVVSLGLQGTPTEKARVIQGMRSYLQSWLSRLTIGGQSHKSHSAKLTLGIILPKRQELEYLSLNSWEILSEGCLGGINPLPHPASYQAVQSGVSFQEF